MLQWDRDWMPAFCVGFLSITQPELGAQLAQVGLHCTVLLYCTVLYCNVLNCTMLNCRCEARAGDGRVVQLPGGWEQLFSVHKVSSGRLHGMLHT